MILGFAAPCESLTLALRNAVEEAKDCDQPIHIWTPTPGDLISSIEPPLPGIPFLRVLPDGTVYLAMVENSK